MNSIPDFPPCLKSKRSSFTEADPMKEPLSVGQPRLLEWDTRMPESSLVA